jgi:hypothetical protein
MSTKQDVTLLEWIVFGGMLISGMFLRQPPVVCIPATAGRGRSLICRAGRLHITEWIGDGRWSIQSKLNSMFQQSRKPNQKNEEKLYNTMFNSSLQTNR